MVAKSKPVWTDQIRGGNWKVPYFDGSGDGGEVALSDSGKYLMSNGASAAPSFESLTPSFPYYLNGYRLSLTYGTPLKNYLRAKRQSISSTNTTTEVLTVTGHGYSTHDVLMFTADGGGLTKGAAYYAYVIDADTFSLHTNYSDASAGTNPVDLTASITAEVYESNKPRYRYDEEPLQPASTDTGADTVTFALSHGWSSGQAVQVDSSGGGLSSGATYYAYASSVLSISFHTTFADSLTGANPVNLSASITADVFSAKLYLEPMYSSQMALYDGADWAIYSTDDVSISLVSLTANTAYDIYGYVSSGDIALETASWTGQYDRTTELDYVDGVRSKSGDDTRRYLGTIWVGATTGQVKQCHDSIGVWNKYNQVALPVWQRDDSTWSWSYSGYWTNWNSDDTNKIEVILGESGSELVNLSFSATIGDDNNYAGVGIGLDSSIHPSSLQVTWDYMPTLAASEHYTATSHFKGVMINPGKHDLYMLQASGSSMKFISKLLSVHEYGSTMSGYIIC